MQPRSIWGGFNEVLTHTTQPQPSEHVLKALGNLSRMCAGMSGIKSLTLPL